jgi:lipid II:glycine glycyltransferase (peptidoglycan interpeptide bridge formation enzyme)
MGECLMFYQYFDPFNTSGYAEVMKDIGFDTTICGKTFLYTKKTFLGRIGQVYYPMENVSIPSSVRFCEVRGLLEPLPCAKVTDYNNIVHVDLSASPDAIFKWLDKQRRWGIRKALERGAQVYSADTKDAFNDFWEIYQATARRRNNTLMSRKLLEKIFMKKDLARLFIVEARNRTIGAYLTIHSKDLARHFHSGFLNKFKEYHPNELGHYYAIQYFHEKGLKVYDMGGAGKTARKGDFKIGWGKLIRVYQCQFCSSRILAVVVRNYMKTKIWIRKYYGG